MSGEQTTLFLQSAIPGVSPYCGGRHMWGSALSSFSAGRRAVALELPGNGGHEGSAAVPTVEVMAGYVVQYIKAQGSSRVHLVGHDVAGLAAVLIALEHPDLLSSITVVSSAWTAPSGDGVEDYTLRHPPTPLMSRHSQVWALEQLSYSHQHIDDALIQGCLAAASGSAHLAAREAMQGDGFSRIFMASATRAKYRFFQAARGDGLKVPVQVIAAQQDRIVSVQHMLALFRILAERQKNTQFHIINRAGSFPFREQPDEFYRLVYAFEDGLAMQSQREKEPA